MTFAAHGMLAGGLFGLFVIWCKRLWIRVSMAVFGFLGGIAPDAVDFVSAEILHLTPRWELYSRMHTGDLVQYFNWHIGYFLHLEVDHTIHKWPGYDWWNQYWAGEILLWVIGGGLLYFVFRKELKALWQRFRGWLKAWSWIRTRLK